MTQRKSPLREVGPLRFTVSLDSPPPAACQLARGPESRPRAWQTPRTTTPSLDPSACIESLAPSGWRHRRSCFYILARSFFSLSDLPTPKSLRSVLSPFSRGPRSQRQRLPAGAWRNGEQMAACIWVLCGQERGSKRERGWHTYAFRRIRQTIRRLLPCLLPSSMQRAVNHNHHHHHHRSFAFAAEHGGGFRAEGVNGDGEMIVSANDSPVVAAGGSARQA
ncbi:hypothetical protein MAPG_03139 [Magnaporthiopsis poae ATCC 64411]|uniref:Uncharacterized protein n=1 Tax=Magnaporthiopsis poae (strain ATCC 64411 / 73-15) TaxID=644358 RepID=A0A0C4DT80_MAGP6|nr:hypothetical protein MAPG_03139 [Magnaporthiopsis poae ATCC 64411]